MDLEGEVLLVMSLFLFAIIWSIMFYLGQKLENIKNQILAELKKGNSVVLHINNVKRVLEGKEWTIIKRENTYFLTNLEESFCIADILKEKIKLEFIKGE